MGELPGICCTANLFEKGLQKRKTFHVHSYGSNTKLMVTQGILSCATIPMENYIILGKSMTTLQNLEKQYL